ncbi:hypothetical protein ACFE04_015187 [Oxalis oulophora]
MMCRGADCGCATQQRPCCPNTFNFHKITDLPSLYIDTFSQARKSLCELGSYENETDNVKPTVPTLPTGLANLLKNRNHTSSGSIRKRKHRKAHFSFNKKSSSLSQADKVVKRRNVWVETDAFFRDVALPDIDTLHEVSTVSSLAAKKLFFIPYFKCEKNDSSVCRDTENGTVNGGDVENTELNEEATAQSLEIDSISDKDETCVIPDSDPAGLEWILGSRTRMLLTSDKPSKKRKLLGTDAGLEKLLIGCPCHENPSLCHYCCKGDLGLESNQLIVCTSCQAAVHQKCYGVQGLVDGPWLCSWCKDHNCRDELVKQPCIFCPKIGGALKPVHRIGENIGATEFAHLFCALLMPEVYIDNLTKMEPIRNVEGISETRKKLICNVCKVKCGACIRCTNGVCRASFHPLCAREASHRVEVWAKYGIDNIELRAFCSKHSTTQIKSRGTEDSCFVVGDELVHAKRTRKVGDRITLKNRSPDTTSDKSNETELQETGVPASLHNPSGLQKKAKAKLSPHADSSDVVTVSDSDISDVVIVKSLFPGRKTKNSIRILGDNIAKNSADESCSDTEVSNNDVKVDHLVLGGSDNLNEGVADEKNMTNADCFQDSLTKDLPETEGNHVSVVIVFLFSDKNIVYGLGGSNTHSTSILSREADPQLETQENVDHDFSEAPNVSSVVPDLMKTEAFSNYYVHPSVRNNLLQRDSGVLLKGTSHELDEIREGETSFLEVSSSDHHSNNAKCKDGDHNDFSINIEQLIKARKMGILDLCAQDEVEGEIVYFQHRLLSNEAARKKLTDNLVYKVSQRLPKEIDVARGKKWDSVLANQYLRSVRDAKKLGWREKKHIEAHAELAATRAAVATSSRISSFRKDAPENSHQEISLNTPNGRASVSSQLMTRPKETVPSIAGRSISFEKHSESVQPVSEFSKDHPKSCDICRRSETMLNPILVCYGCKVGVHLDCYRSVNESPGPWYCELCEELSRTNSAPSVNFWENPYFIAECLLCGGSTGAFRKSIDEQWVHAFCAEWVFETTFRRGQVNPVEGLETACRGVDICCICWRKNGICLKCNHGQCQTKFHPSCARSAGFYLNVNANDGKLQHKAYCAKHSLGQSAKAEPQKHGIEELKTIRQMRVELERLRLLSERIVKREKLKRELVISSHCILACKRDQIARSVPVHSLVLPDVSSESATTSLKGHTDGYSAGQQRSDDVTVESTSSVKLRTKNHSVDTDQKTDDSSTSQDLFTRKPTERMQFAGKQIPNRLGRTLSDDGEWSSQFSKSELLMTSDQASMKNQLLASMKNQRLVSRGFAYVPKDAISNEKQMNQEECSSGPIDQDEWPPVTSCQESIKTESSKLQAL